MLKFSTIGSPEFINLQPLEINPFMAKCEIKVLYLGKNRNRTFITKEIATKMSKTLRGAPIVGYYKENKKDFHDHGEKITIDRDGLEFECLTRPYGFVAPDAKVWFQKFQEQDEKGKIVEREYLMTTGYLWTQYEEVQDVAENGRPESMELDNDTLVGNWSKKINPNIEFFIINDAIFTKLCILGKDIEPCFEGSSITPPEVSKNFALNENFKQNLCNMMQQLCYVLQGGKSMDENNALVASEETKATDVNVNINFTAQDNSEQKSLNGNKNFMKEEEEKEKENTSDSSKSENNKEQGEKEDKKKKEYSKKEGEENEDIKKKYSLLEEKYNDLENKFSQFQTEYSKLVKFKNDVEDKEKDDLINSFYMLSEDDKKDVIINKAKYSLDEIESKLSVICVRKKVNFNLDNQSSDNNNNNEDPITTYNLTENVEDSIPAWISAVKNTRDSRNM